MTAHTKVLRSYDDVADEYYDSVRHPTCANFAELSQSLIRAQISSQHLSGRKILEVGCGQSISAPILSECGVPLSCLTLIDQSPKMLQHSAKWKRQGARLLIAEAQNTGLPSSQFHLIVSSLGDPYNSRRFWAEIQRMLVPDGICVFTTPSREWAERFRNKTELGIAEFVRTDGAKVFVRSDIPTVQEQQRIIAEAQLQAVDVATKHSGDISGPISPKLLVSEGEIIPIVRCFVARKRL